MQIELDEKQRFDLRINKPNEKSQNKDKELIYYTSQEVIKKLFEKINSIFKLNFNGLKYIERGGGSFIYEASLPNKKNPLIIKVISDKRCKSINEIKIMNKLRHKNIISIFGYYMDKNGDEFIIMEKGKMDLKAFQFNFLKRYVLSETFLCYAAFQILEGLKYLHRCNIIHYDIKPNNIVIDEFLNIKIIDFSTSLDISEIKDPFVQTKYRGTTLYMAPEVMKRDKINIKDYHKIDLFSLGIMLYRLAFGFYPFNLQREDVDNDDIILSKINSDFKVENIETEFSKYFIDFLNGLLEKDIKKRININEALNHPWIKGAKILLEEKETINNATIFLTSLITDNFMKFNSYIL
jgi:serine/threonine protein kinase